MNAKVAPSLLNVLEGGKRGWAISLRRMYAVTADPSEDLCHHRCPRNVTNCCVNGGHSYCDWPAQYSCFLLCISAAVFKRNCERKITCLKYKEQQSYPQYKDSETTADSWLEISCLNKQHTDLPTEKKHDHNKVWGPRREKAQYCICFYYG